MPNRRRRRLSTALSTVAALAVASPVAVVALSDISERQPQHREFVQAASITDLPGELMNALSQGLSQFGINLPPMPTGLLTGTSPAPTTVTPGLGTPGLTAPGLTTPGLTSPTGVSPTLTDPALASPDLTAPGGLTTPGVTPTLTDPAVTVPGLSTPPALTDPTLGAAPISTSALPATGEIPISAPVGLDPALGAYPILGDPSLAAPVAPASGGLLGDLTSAANSLGAGEAIDLLKGIVMPAIMSAVKPPAEAAAPIAGAAAEAAALPAEAAVTPGL